MNRNNNTSGAVVGGALLVVVGLLALVANLGGDKLIYESIPLAIGAAFGVAYAFTRKYGFLVPAGILMGVGGGLVAADLLNQPDAGPYVGIAGGLGFLAVFVVDMLVSGTPTRWWPVIPGAVMLFAGAAAASESNADLKALQIWSPVLLIALGVLILLTRIRRPTH